MAAELELELEWTKDMVKSVEAMAPRVSLRFAEKSMDKILDREKEDLEAARLCTWADGEAIAQQLACQAKRGTEAGKAREEIGQLLATQQRAQRNLFRTIERERKAQAAKRKIKGEEVASRCEAVIEKQKVVVKDLEEGLARLKSGESALKRSKC